MRGKLKSRRNRRTYPFWIGLFLVLFSIISYQVGHTQVEKRSGAVYRVKIDSGYDPIMANYREYGFNAVLPKPFDIGGLGQVLRKLLSG